MAALKEIGPDYLVLAHCCGERFYDFARAEMPDKGHSLGGRGQAHLFHRADVAHDAAGLAQPAGVPEPQRLIQAAREQEPAIPAEGERLDAVGMSPDLTLRGRRQRGRKERRSGAT